MMNIRGLKEEYRSLLSDWDFISSVFYSFVLFLISLIANFKAILFSKADVGSATTDLLLDNIPVINTDIVFSEGALLFIILTALLLLLKPKVIPFALKSLAILIIVRSLFVVLTHLGPYPDRITTDLDTFRYVTAGADLFFSGHTAIPYLFALIFWDNVCLRILFLCASATAATAVLLGHLHYSIDVFASYFIVFGVHHIVKSFLKKDYDRAHTAIANDVTTTA